MIYVVSSYRMKYEGHKWEKKQLTISRHKELWQLA